MLMSCGAALKALHLAMRHFGYQGVVQHCPEPDHPDLVARVYLGEVQEATAEEHALFRAIPARRTYRQRFDAREVTAWQLVLLKSATASEGAWLHVVQDEKSRHAIADLIAEGDRRQWADKRFRRELAAWLHPNRTRSGDGIPGYAFGTSEVVSYVGPFMLRTFDWGRGQAAKDHQLAVGSPVLAVLGTDADNPAAWLTAGQALMRVLLQACCQGMAASFLNQPIEVAELRPRLRDAIGRPGFPQLLLRMGYGHAVHPTPRRPLHEVIV
jgi:hypothetical protein